ncbi:hypothetical protein [Rhizobium sp. BK176]|uniref:hypothetical protein n=1 Tax=Rhizobium sp. BK176 TaxID=2587071 RepID=UPI00216A5E50|nr:hypothetical protein [Rhizobium sp. BK176]MCS4088615.1 hypothetical protein [Rhizobium sp. BK176]
MVAKTHTPESLKAFVDAALAEADERGGVNVTGMSSEEFCAVTWALSDRNLARDAAINEERASVGLLPETHSERLLRGAAAADASVTARSPKNDRR